MVCIKWLSIILILVLSGYGCESVSKKNEQGTVVLKYVREYTRHGPYGMPMKATSTIYKIKLDSGQVISYEDPNNANNFIITLDGIINYEDPRNPEYFAVGSRVQTILCHNKENQ